MIKELTVDKIGLPKDWKMLPFGDVCEISGGSQPPKSTFIYEPKEGYIRLVQVRDYRTDNFITYIPKERAKKFCSKTDIMIGRYGPPIFGIFRGIEGAYNVALMKAIPNRELLDEEYLYWFLKTDSLVKFVEKSSKRAAGQDGVRKEVLYTYPTPIPPLAQQKQIVSILDKAFAAIDRAKANAEQNLQNTKELRISITNNLFNSVENSELLTVDEVTDFITDYVANGSFASLKENVSYKKEKDYAMLLRLVDHSNKYQNPFVYVDKHAFDFLKKSTVYPNDIILSNVGARLGTAFRAPDLGIPMTLGPNSILIKAKEFGDYFYCWLQSAYGQKAIKSVVSGAGQPKFNKTQFKKIKVPIPKSKDDRDNIILKINQANNSVDKLYGVYIKKIADLEEMKKSILQKAFSGQLNTIN